jgi:TonB-linked SusC/RagA family outer membrane protein
LGDFGTARTYNGGSVERNKTSLLDYMITNILSYNRKFDKHNLGLTGVYEANEVNFEGFKSVGTGITDFTLGLNAIDRATLPAVNTSTQWRQAQISYVFRASYDYDSKYFLTGSVRRDASSTFSANNKSGYFPALGFSYIITEEDFMKKFESINLLKLRYTYGVNGNTTSRYSSLSVFDSRPESTYLFGDTGLPTPGLTPTTLGNNNLRWERTTGNNIGLDFGFFNNRLSGSVDYYVNKTTDLLYDVGIPDITGFTSFKTNVGALENKGIEFNINASPIKTTDFEWNVGFNFSQNRSKILSLAGTDLNKDGIEDDILPAETGNGTGGLFIGEPLGTIYNYEQVGIYQIGEPVPAGSGLLPGSYKLKDINGDGRITTADRTKIGTTQPDFMFGISNSLQYKNFGFKFFINSIQGGIAVNDPWGGPTGSSTYTTDTNIVTNNRYDDIDSWTPINPNASYALPGAPKGGVNFTPYRDKSFVRLQDVSFTYSLDNALAKKVGFTSLKLYVSGKNLVTWTKWEGWDPETGQGLGIDVATNTGGVNSGQALPVMKSYTLGLEMSF